MLIALFIGFILIIAYGKFRRFGWRELFMMAVSNVAAARNIVVVMLLVGALTALWRASGTIAYIVSVTSGALQPAIFLPASFVLNALLSVLTGTSVGTAATMGSICMSVGTALGVPPAICGGAVLSGAFFGDRCSPVSTSALLVAEVSQTNIYDNIRGMIRTCVIPFAISLLVFAVGGYLMENAPAETSIANIFEAHYRLHWTLLLPAITILILASLRLDIKLNMVISILLSAILAYCIQGISILQICSTMIFGFDAPEEISSMLSGGGLLGMVKMCVTILISLTYVGLFKGLGILEKLKALISKMGHKVSPFGCTFITGTLTGMICCNQTMSIVLTNEMCANIVPDKNKRALFIENSSVVVVGLIPWNLASLIPLGAMGAPTSAILFAAYLYLIPLTQLIMSRKRS